MRRRVLLAVEAYPGLHLRALQRRAQTSAMLAEYHLNALEKIGLVTSHLERGYRCFFPIRAGPLTLDATDKRWLGLLRRPPILGITLLLLEKRDSPSLEIAHALGMPLSTTLYQLRQMSKDGLIVQDKQGGRTQVALADPERCLELLRSYHPTPDALTRYAELWSRVLEVLGPARPPPPLPPEPAEPTVDLPSPVRQAPLSVQRVYAALLDGPLTGQELVFDTGLARRTVYAALAQIKSMGLLRARGNLKDMRQTQFWVEPGQTPAP